MAGMAQMASCPASSKSAETLHSSGSQMDSLELHLSDRLNTIRPFTEDQILDLWPNEYLKQKDDLIDGFIKENENLSQEKLYILMTKLEKCREQYKIIEDELERLKKNCEEHEECAWDLGLARATGTGRCGCGRSLEASHEHQTAKLRIEQLSRLSANLLLFKTKLTEDHIICLSEIQSTRQQIEIEMSKIIKDDFTDDYVACRSQIRDSISVLFSFERRTVNVDTDTSHLCRKLITQLASRLLTINSEISGNSPLDRDDAEVSLPSAPKDDYGMMGFEDKLFLLNHVLRCPFGVSQWAAPLIQLSVDGLNFANIHLPEDNHVMGLIRQSLALLATILSPVKGRDRFVKDSQRDATLSKGVNQDSDPWLLIDPEIEETEEVDAKSSQLSEMDIISFLEQIQFFDMVNFVFTSNFGHGFDSSGTSQEMLSLKLLSFSTHTIRILRTGLITFNLMRYKNLSEYIKQMIKHTCSSMSMFWDARRSLSATQSHDLQQNCVSYDEALTLRLQVEYDHFILRSVTAILSCQKYGVWRCLSVIEYFGISEPMMWHILWVTFNSGRTDSTDVPIGQVAPYYSDVYWKRRMGEDSFKYLFREKLKILRPTEARYMLDCFLRMILSRPNTLDQMAFVEAGAQEMFSITFDPTVQRQSTIGDKGKMALVLLANRFPYLVSFYIEILSRFKTTSNDDMCLDLFASLDLSDQDLSTAKLNLFSDWLIDSEVDSLHNRAARLILSRLNWNCARNGSTLHLSIQIHRHVALLIYKAYQKHYLCTFAEGTKPTGEPISFSSIANSKMESAITSAARATNRELYAHWSWTMLLLLRLDLLSQPDLVWLDIINNSLDEEIQKQSAFFPQPDITQDAELLPLFRGYERSEPMAVLIALLMCYNPLSAFTLQIYIDAFALLVNFGHQLMAMNVLRLTSFHTGFSDGYKNEKFNLAAHKLIVSLDDSQLNSLVGAVDAQLERLDLPHQIRLVIDWILLCYEIMQTIFKNNSSSWFGGATKTALDRVAYMLDGLVHCVFARDSLRRHFLKAFSQLNYDIHGWKLNSSGFFSTIFSWGNRRGDSANSGFRAAQQRKSDWLTPLHLLVQEFPEMGWISWLLFESDSIKMEKIWEHSINHLSGTAAAISGGDSSAVSSPTSGSSVSSSGGTGSLDLDGALKRACEALNVPQLQSCFLPLYSLADFLMIAPDHHPITPILWFNFFVYYFSNGVSACSFGARLIDDVKLKALRKKLNSLVDKHHALSVNVALNSSSSSLPAATQQSLSSLLVKFYRACLIWFSDPALHEAFVDMSRLPLKYQPEILKCIMNPSRDTHTANDEFEISRQAKELIEWNHVRNEIESKLESWNSLFKFSCSVCSISESSVTETAKMIIPRKPRHIEPSELVEHRARDACLYDIPQSPSSHGFSPLNGNDNISWIMWIVAHQMIYIDEERAKIDKNAEIMAQLDEEFVGLVKRQYDTPNRQVTIKRACCTGKNSVPSESDSHCLSPANIIINFVDGIENRPTTKLMIKNRTQYATLVECFLENPSQKFSNTVIFVEQCLSKVDLIGHKWNAQDEKYWTIFLDTAITMAPHFCMTTFEPAKRIYQLVLEFICSVQYTDKRDEINRRIVNTIIHDGRCTQLLAPYINVNESCSRDSFLHLYRDVILSLDRISPQVSFVLLSKFDTAKWLKEAVNSEQQRLDNSEPKYYEMFVAQVSDALRKLGPNPDDDLLMVLGLLRKHFQYVVTCSFPHNIQTCVKMLLDGLDGGFISGLLWPDFLKAFGIFPESDEQSNKMYARFSRYARTQDVLNETEVYKVLRQL